MVLPVWASAVGSFFGSSAFQGAATAAGIGLTWNQYRHNKQLAHRQRVAEREALRQYMLERTRQREYDSPLNQVRRMREAGLSPSRISPGAYGDVVMNSSAMPSPVNAPYQEILGMYGNFYNVQRQKRMEQQADKEHKIQFDLNVQRQHLENQILQHKVDNLTKSTPIVHGDGSRSTPLDPKIIRQLQVLQKYKDSRYKNLINNAIKTVHLADKSYDLYRKLRGKPVRNYYFRDAFVDYLYSR